MLECAAVNALALDVQGEDDLPLKPYMYPVAGEGWAPQQATSLGTYPHVLHKAPCRDRLGTADKGKRRGWLGREKGAPPPKQLGKQGGA